MKSFCITIGPHPEPTLDYQFSIAVAGTHGTTLMSLQEYEVVNRVIMRAMSGARHSLVISDALDTARSAAQR